MDPLRTIEPALLHEDGAWFVLSKPVGWHCVSGRTSAGDEGEGVVADWLALRRPELADLPESGLVHRLDRDTSGCLVVAKDALSRARLRERFSGASDVRKVYLCRALPGLPDEDRATLYFSSRHKGSAKVTVRQTGSAEEVGRLRWKVRERSRLGDLVEVELVGPGRRHQIRAGLAHLGHPLVGDALYGADDGMPLLHAWAVELDGVRVEAPLPGWASSR